MLKLIQKLLQLLQMVAQCQNQAERLFLGRYVQNMFCSVEVLVQRVCIVLYEIYIYIYLFI